MFRALYVLSVCLWVGSVWGDWLCMADCIPTCLLSCGRERGWWAGGLVLTYLCGKMWLVGFGFCEGKGGAVPWGCLVLCCRMGRLSGVSSSES